MGNFNLDENSFFGGIWKGYTRHTWEIPNTFVGHTFTQGRNSFGRVDRVEFNAGATFAISENVADMKGWRGVSLGNFNTIKLGGAFTDLNENIFWHEYGHTRDSRLFGPFYILIIGIPSASGAQWTEDRADEYSRRYRRRHRIPF